MKKFFCFILALIFLVSNLLILKDLNLKKELKNIKTTINTEIINNENKSIENTRKNVLKDFSHINSDIKGWIYIENTSIDYPVLKGEDNLYYLNRDYKKKSNKYGSIFIDENFNKDSKNLILYGHNMKDNAMFGELKKFKNIDFFNNSYIYIVLEDSLYKFKPISIYESDLDFDYLKSNFNSNDDYLNYIFEITEKSIFKNTTKIIDSSNDLLTLSTCGKSKNKRLVVHCIKV